MNTSVKYVKNVFVIKNCARTNGADLLIDGGPVNGVQVYTSLDDNKAPATTYYGPGELVVTDPSGLALDSVTANDKTMPGIKIAQRSLNGENTFGSKTLEGKAITGFDIQKYIAPSECAVTLSAIDASLVDFSYTVKIRKYGSDLPVYNETPVVRTAIFKTSAVGNTDVEILQGLADVINRNINIDKDDEIQLEAILDVAGTGLMIRALPKTFAVGKFHYSKYTFTVDTNFDMTMETNLGQDITFDGAPVLKFTQGNGTYEQVAELEWATKGYTGANRYKFNPPHTTNLIGYDVEKFQSDGVTPMQYDLLNITWEADYGDLGRANQQGNVVIALPVEDNAVNQQQVIVDTLEAYIINAFGLEVPVPSLT